MNDQKLLIVGSSVRAAAQSALRAGYHPLAIDQFSDQDLHAICLAKEVADYPSGIVELAKDFPLCPFLYTGAVENHLEVIEQLSSYRPLLGNNPEVLRAVRDPWTLRKELINQGLLFPEIHRADQAVPPGDWLRKPFRTGGGIGIQRLNVNGHSLTNQTTTSVPYFIERVVPGEPISAIFVAAAGEIMLLGATRQLVGSDWAGGDDYLFVGNIGPLPVSPHVKDSLMRIGNCIAQNFRLTGLFGVDAILRGEEVWTLEVNPRYTAAVEILERASDLHSIRLHVEACQTHQLPALNLQQNTVLHGKAVLHARSLVTIQPGFMAWVDRMNGKSLNHVVADIPQPGITLKRRQSICTIFAEGQSVEVVETSLRKLADTAFSVLEESSDSPVLER